MQNLNFPSFDIKTRVLDGQSQVFDPIRKKYVALIPEEWVRQHVIYYLVEERKYSINLMAVEHPFTINRVKHRADIVAFDSLGRPILVVECKAPEVNIDDSTIHQVTRYNLFLRAPFIIVTNGLVHFCARIDFEKGQTTVLKQIPLFTDIINNHIE